MGRAQRRQILKTLGFVMLLGIAVYFMLWTVDYRNSSSDAELMRYLMFSLLIGDYVSSSLSLLFLVNLLSGLSI